MQFPIPQYGLAGTRTLKGVMPVGDLPAYQRLPVYDAAPESLLRGLSGVSLGTPQCDLELKIF